MKSGQKDTNYIKFFQACWRGDVKTVKEIVNQGYDVYTTNESGYNAFEIAAKEKHIELFEFLLLVAEKKPKVKEEYLVKQMYIEGFIKGNINIIKRMDELFKKYDIDSDIEYGWTPLMYAAYYGRFEIVKYLISKAKIIFLQKYNILAAIKKAGYENHWKIVEYLLSLDVDHNVKDYAGNTFLTELAGYKFPNSKYFIKAIEKGIDPDIQNDEGQTALMVASGNKQQHKIENISDIENINYDSHFELVEILINASANVNVKDKKGKTAYDYAIESGNYKIAEFLNTRMKIKKDFDFLSKKKV